MNRKGKRTEMAKCKLCPRRKVCKDECYGENPCDFAVAFDRLGRKIDVKAVCVESLRSELLETEKSVPKHRVFGAYVLTPVPNAFNDKTSWWISKKGRTAAHYCFTASSQKEADWQIENGLQGYIDLLNFALGDNRTVEIYGMVFQTPPAELARLMIEDLGNGRSDGEDRWSGYFVLAESIGDRRKTVSVALGEEKENLPESEWGYVIHLIDDIEGSDCELYHTDHLSEEELVALLKETMSQLGKECGK